MSYRGPILGKCAEEVGSMDEQVKETDLFGFFASKWIELRGADKTPIKTEEERKFLERLEQAARRYNECHSS